MMESQNREGMRAAAKGRPPITPTGAWAVNVRMAGMLFQEGAMTEKTNLQMYDISREDFENLGRNPQEQEEFVQMVIEVLKGLDATRAKMIHMDPDKVALYTRSIEAATQRIGLPVIIKPLSDGMAIALETDEDRARAVRLAALTHPPSP